MRELVLGVISSAAAAAELSVPVMFAAKKDNITLPLPRIEVSLGSCAYERTGRRLGFLVSLDECSIKREIYRIIQKVTVTLFSDDESFLATAVPALVKKLPRGLNDNQGNWVKILVKSGGHAGYEVPKVSETPIDPLPKRRETLELEFTGRLTTLEPVEFINNFNISANRGEDNG